MHYREIVKVYIFLYLKNVFDLFLYLLFQVQKSCGINGHFRSLACRDCDDPVLFALCSFVCVTLNFRGEQIRFVCNYEVL